MSKFTQYIGSQFGNPRGLVGKICCLIMNTINKAMYKNIVNYLEANSNSNILDIGYGNGYLLEKICRKTRAVLFGIDISEDMKLLATKRNKKAVREGKLILSIGDCCKLDFADSFFDVITSVNTIYFWTDTNKAMDEIYRTLKNGGIFYNAVYSKEWLNKLSYTKTGFKMYEKEDYIEMGKTAGFSDVVIKDIVNGKSYLVEYHKGEKNVNQR